MYQNRSDMSKEYLLKDAINKHKHRTLYIGAWSGWFYIGDNNCEEELKEVSRKSHDIFKRAVSEAEKKYQFCLKNYEEAKKKKPAKELLDLAEEALREAKDNLEWFEEHPDFMDRKVLSDTERIRDEDGDGRLIKIEGLEQARYWTLSEYRRDHA